jgi:hypothetical protein
MQRKTGTIHDTQAQTQTQTQAQTPLAQTQTETQTYSLTDTQYDIVTADAVFKQRR